MKKLPKPEREKLARKIYDRLKKLGIKMSVEGNWTKMEGGQVPVDILMDSGLCADELAAVVRAEEGK